MANKKNTQDDYINNSKCDNTQVISNIRNDFNLITTEKNKSDKKSLVKDKNIPEAIQIILVIMMNLNYMMKETILQTKKSVRMSVLW